MIASLTPNDYSVYHASYWVQVKPGNNLLQFDGASHSNSFGMNIDNVKVTSIYSGSSNLVKNGNFEAPNLAFYGVNWKYFPGGIPYWQAVKAEVGKCKLVYNSNWPLSTGQCIELDSTSNQRYTQVITVSQCQFT